MATAAIISNRERQRRFRQRQREPARVVYRVEVNRDRLINALIDAGYIEEDESWQRDLIEATLSGIIDRLDLPKRKP
jgi:hypothetical protein